MVDGVSSARAKRRRGAGGHGGIYKIPRLPGFPGSSFSSRGSVVSPPAPLLTPCGLRPEQPRGVQSAQEEHEDDDAVREDLDVLANGEEAVWRRGGGGGREGIVGQVGS